MNSNELTHPGPRSWEGSSVPGRAPSARQAPAVLAVVSSAHPGEPGLGVRDKTERLHRCRNLEIAANSTPAPLPHQEDRSAALSRPLNLCDRLSHIYPGQKCVFLHLIYFTRGLLRCPERGPQLPVPRPAPSITHWKGSCLSQTPAQSPSWGEGER